jgi:tRNA threonylcarbamoyladenosine biosynthesis protein TsaE
MSGILSQFNQLNLNRNLNRNMPLAPTDNSNVTLWWHNEADTQAFAEQLALIPAIRDALVTLHGDLGSGKTTFVRHLLRALGVQGRIKSPSYAVVEPHQAPYQGRMWEAWHFDFYRFNDPREWEDAGFRDVFASAGLKLVEWPEKAGATLPPPDLSLTITPQDPDATHGDDADAPPRHIRLQAYTPLGRRCLQTIQNTKIQKPSTS